MSTTEIRTDGSAVTVFEPLDIKRPVTSDAEPAPVGKKRRRSAPDGKEGGGDDGSVVHDS